MRHQKQNVFDDLYAVLEKISKELSNAINANAVRIEPMIGCKISEAMPSYVVIIIAIM